MSDDPVAFLSYVRSDDQHENGRLTQFRERLSGEVRLQTGEPFQIFQDRNDIAWGQQWKQRIEDSLNAATFLIPVITPGFFKSPACRDELERFLDREKKLRRMDLILPLYYVECPILTDKQKGYADSLARIIAERQHVDWRELRFEPFTAPEVGRTIARMARQVVETLERDRSGVIVIKTEIAEAAPTTATTSAAEKIHATVGATVEPTRGPAQKTEAPILVVDALHRGDHPTLTAALKAAEPGTRILVRPGLYREGVVIDKPVEIIGDGERSDIVIEASGKNTILFQSDMGRAANLTLRQVGDGQFYCVNIAQGRLDLEDCDITSQCLACVAIHGGADPRLRRNRIHGGKSSGVFVFDNGRGTLEDNEILAHALAGVSIKTGGNPTLRRNQIHDGRAGGVLIYENGQGTLEDNDIFANTFSGVEIRSGGIPTVRRNRIHDGKQCGVMVHTDGQGTLDDNDIFANGLSGVEIRAGGNPTLRRNRIHAGKKSGILVHKDGLGTLEDNDVFANTRAGVWISGGNPTLRRNRISDNKLAGISVKDGGGGVFEENDLRGNASVAWKIDPSCLDKVKRNGNIE